MNTSSSTLSSTENLRIKVHHYASAPVTCKYIITCICISIFLGLLVRIPYFIHSDFPLNDGGLFMLMINAIKMNNYFLPEVVHYNGEQIPFAYPPFALYVAAIISALGFDVIEVIRYLPLVFNILTICAFILLASKVLNNRYTLLFAAILFPIIPKSYEWLIMGGGITRSVGFFFTVLSIYIAILISSNLRTIYFVLLIVSISIAVLSHPEWGITAILISSLIIFIKANNKVYGIGILAAMGIGTLLLTSPWWANIILRFGFQPFVAASTSSYWGFADFLRRVIRLEIFTQTFTIMSWAAVIGFLYYASKRDWLIPVWLLLVYLTTPRDAPSAATVPYAMLSALGVYLIVKYLASWTLNILDNSHILVKFSSYLNLSKLILPAFNIIASIVIVGIFMATLFFHDSNSLNALTHEERDAMEWIKNNTPHEASFLVLSPSAYWHDDYVAEWFPALSERRSITTVQGLEWVYDENWHQVVNKVQMIKSIQAIELPGDIPHRLYEYLESKFSNQINFVSVFLPDADPAFGGFLSSNMYELIYQRENVLIFERKTY